MKFIFPKCKSKIYHNIHYDVNIAFFIDKEDKQLQQMIDTNTSLINEVNQRRHNASMQEKDELIEKLTKLLQRNYKVMKAMKTKRKKNTRIREAYVKHLEQKVRINNSLRKNLSRYWNED